MIRGRIRVRTKSESLKAKSRRRRLTFRCTLQLLQPVEVGGVGGG